MSQQVVEPGLKTQHEESAVAALYDGLTQRQIPALDGIRAVAVFLVILFHASFPWIPGPHGVLIFFVLSGFLITWLLLKEDERRGSVSLSAFYKRRSLRIFPAFYVFWFVYVGYAAATLPHPPWGAYAAAFFYLSDYYRALVPGVSNNMGHTWSLAIEEQFYLLWPLLFIRFSRNLSRLAVLLTSLIGVIWIARALRYAWGVPSEYLYHAFDTRVDHILVGCLLAIVLKLRLFPALWNKLCASYVPFLAVALFAVSAFVSHNNEAYRYTAGYSLEPVLVAILICQMIALHNKPVWSVLDWSPVALLGRISYALYLYHPLTFKVVHDLWPTMAYRYKAPLGYGLTIACAYLSYRLIEMPFLRLKERAARV